MDFAAHLSFFTLKIVAAFLWENVGDQADQDKAKHNPTQTSHDEISGKTMSTDLQDVTKEKATGSVCITKP